MPTDINQILNGPNGRVKACTECRQHKLRCDAHLDYSQPCSRCKKMNLACLVTRQWKRSKRQSKADLIRENDVLRKQLLSESAEVTSSEQSPGWLSSTRSSAPRESASQFEATMPLPQVGGSASGAIQSHIPGCSDNNIVDSAPNMNGLSSVGDISPDQIAYCFVLFFRHYEQFVPGLFDATLTPKQYHEESPFLFWAIVCTGARKYPKDSTVLERASKMLMEVALPSLYSFVNPLRAIQAVMIFCHWPLPMNTTFKDPSHAFAGAATQIGLQIGLHINGHEQDFARTQLRYSKKERLFRARTWIHWCIILQNTNLTGGLPFWSSEITPHYHNWRLDTMLHRDQLHQFQIHKLHTVAIAAISRDTAVESADSGPALTAMIELFDQQIQSLSLDGISMINRFVQLCSRLSIRAYHFFAKPDSARSSGLLLLFSLACRVIDEATALDQAQDFALYATESMKRMLNLAGCSILKITRSHLSSHIDLHIAEEAIFKTITFLRRRSIQQSDLDSRMAAVFHQLWFSKTAFKSKDGSLNGLHLLCRTRLFMSLVYDSCWWWRMEFRGEPYRTDTPDSDAEEGTEAETPATAESLGHVSTKSAGIDTDTTMAFRTPINSGNSHFPLTPSFDTFPDWEWASSLGFQHDMNISLPALTLQEMGP